MDSVMRRRIESVDYDVRQLYEDLRREVQAADDARDRDTDRSPEERHAAMVLDHVIEATDGMDAAAKRMRYP